QTWQPLAGPNKFITDSSFNRTEKLHASPASDSIYFTPELLRWDGTAFQRTLNMEMDGRYGYLSGDFTSLDGQPYSYVARFDSQTGQWDDMNGGLPGPVNYTYDPQGLGKAFVVGNIAHIWNGTEWVVDDNITLPEPLVAGGNIDAEAFFANGDVFGRFTYWPPQDYPANSPVYFVWNELDKSVTLHPSPSGIPTYALPNYYGQAIAHAPNPQGTEVVVALNFGNDNDDGGTYWQLWWYDLAAQTWEALTSETAGDYLSPTPYALTNFGSHIYFGGDLQEAGDKVALGFGRWVQTSADLAVRQSVGNPAVAVGVPFEVVLEVENLGPDTAVSTALTNTLPSEL
ncbi:MAG: hypothetical protein KDD89_16150, partial [Anaerolineales bacterium]|nr:hypothetical protein [Anaerolineales bacterium]